ncbi:MAG: DUF4147 domain-containing protein [Chloroflexi bacterium]|nr:DUF4147 domain-containing protein [Chloroflexota bacterium]
MKKKIFFPSDFTETIFPVKKIEKVIFGALAAADPYLAVHDQIHRSEGQLFIADRVYKINSYTRIIIIAIGKASLAMVDAVNEKIGPLISQGICVCKKNPRGRKRIGNIEIMIGGHPVPDQNSVIAGDKILQSLKMLSRDDIVLLLISGGGSALVCNPAKGISLDEIQSLTKDLLKSGATINELNAVRKHLDILKGGGLLKMAVPAQLIGFVISDVVDNPLDVIASGPAVPDPTTYHEAMNIITKYLPREKIPAKIIERFERGIKGNEEESLKPDDPLTKNAYHKIVASNISSVSSAIIVAAQQGFHAQAITTRLTGEASSAGVYLANILKEVPAEKFSFLGIAGGETTVKVKGNGLGGRNLEVALAAVKPMDGLKDALLITFASDGEDGQTDAAGAFVTGNTFQKALEMGLDPDLYLENNDSYHFFKKVGGLIITGSTGTNVNDLNFIFRL